VRRRGTRWPGSFVYGTRVTGRQRDRHEPRSPRQCTHARRRECCSGTRLWPTSLAISGLAMIITEWRRERAGDRRSRRGSTAGGLSPQTEPSIRRVSPCSSDL